MKKRRLKVVVLYNLLERLEKGEEKDRIAEEAIREEIGAVETALRTLGHDCVVMSIRHEIFSVVHWLTETRPDVVFNLCESVYGNACLEMNIPALLDLFHIPYTGSPPLTLGLCQNKGRVKDVLMSQGIQTPPYEIFPTPAGLNSGMLFPVIVKPLHEDGSLGISRESVVYDDNGLRRQVEYVLEAYKQPALVEAFIDGREMNVGMIELNGKVEPLPISEIDFSEFPEGLPKICGYDAKWMTESPEYQRSKPLCPAPLEKGLKKRLESTAMEAYRLLECRDYARVDIRVDREEKIFVIEVNPNPDISPDSGMARALKAQGMTYTGFVEGLLEKAVQRKRP
jgi:D-alanine-D-alanine ligase